MTRTFVAFFAALFLGQVVHGQGIAEPPVHIYEGGEFKLATLPQVYHRNSESQWSGHINYIIGYKGLKAEWAPSDNQFEFGLFDLDFKPPNWPVYLVVQLSVSNSDDLPDQPGFIGDFTDTFEANFGLRKIWEGDPLIHPFISGGVSILGASTSSNFGCGCIDVEDNDSDVGAWVSTGFYWILTPEYHLGFQVAYSSGDVELFGRELDAGGVHVQLLIGLYRW